LRPYKYIQYIINKDKWPSRHAHVCLSVRMNDEISGTIEAKEFR